MKPIFRLMMMFVTALLFVALIGCGGDDDDDTDMDIEEEEVTLDFVDTAWQVKTINGATFEALFQPADSEFETEFMVGDNSWTFNEDGTFTGALEFVLTEKYTEPVSSMTQEITLASEGTYTTEGSTFTIATHDLSIDVDVSLEPEEVWQAQIVGKTVEEFEMDLAAETKLGFSPTAKGALFRAGTEFSWSVDGEKLSLSSALQNVGLEKVAE